MKERNDKLSSQDFRSFVKAVLKKRSLEENKPLYFEYRLSESGVADTKKSIKRVDAFAPDGLFRYREPVVFEIIDSCWGGTQKTIARIEAMANSYRNVFGGVVIFFLRCEKANQRNESNHIGCGYCI